MKRRRFPFFSVAVALLVAAIAFPSAAQTISIQIHEPAANALVADSVSVRATVQSTFAITEVKATVTTREAVLVYDDSSDLNAGWKGTVSLTGLVRGTYTLVVTVRTIDGSVGSAQRTIRIDRPPVVTVTSPLTDSVARPSIRFTATCEDDDPAGCTSLQVQLPQFFEPPIVFASGTSSIDQTISLAAYDGSTLGLQVIGRDSAQQPGHQTRTIHVESSVKLQEVGSVAGRIIDVNLERILYRDPVTQTFVIRNRTGGEETVIPNPTGKTPRYGFLSPKGAIFVASGTSTLSEQVFEWRDGQMLAFGFPNSANSLRVRGDFAIWVGDRTTTYSGETILFRRDLQAGTTIELGSVGNTEDDVAANGAVAYWSRQYQVFLYNNGIAQQLTNDSTKWHTYPVTDGTSVIYRKHGPCCEATTYQIVRNNNGVETVLETRSSEPAPGWHYQLVNGWAAFTRSQSGAFQVWVSSPTAGERQASIFGSHSFIDSLLPNGDVTFLNSGRRYLSMAGRPPIDLSSDLGQLVQLGGERYVFIGRTLFRVTLPTRGDANGDGIISSPDLFYMINNLFGSGSPPVVNSDFNGDGSMTVTDVFYAINYLFSGGPGPVGGT